MDEIDERNIKNQTRWENIEIHEENIEGMKRWTLKV